MLKEYCKIIINSAYEKRLLSILTAKDTRHYDAIIGGEGLFCKFLVISLIGYILYIICVLY